MQAKSEKLTARQEKAILAILSEPGVEAAAAAVGVNPATLWRWQKEPAFREALADARREAFSTATTRIAGACAGAVETLRSIAADKDAPTSARVSAAKAILDGARQALEVQDLDARIAAIEERMRGSGTDEDTGDSEAH